MTLRRSSLWLAVVLGSLTLAGCPLQTSTSSTLPAVVSAPSSPSPSAASSSSGGEHVDPKEPVIVGLSVADATAKIKASGFDGKIEVFNNSEFDPSCKADTVCGFDPRRWYLNQDHRMTLYVNRKLAIGAPE